MKRFFLAFLFFCAAAFAAQANTTNVIPWRVVKYSLVARQMALREAFETFGVTEGCRRRSSSSACVRCTT